MKVILNSNLNTSSFDASQLKVGEMMLVIEEGVYKGDILLKTYNSVVSLVDPSFTWNPCINIKGRKLLQGESVTLIVE